MRFTHYGITFQSKEIRYNSAPFQSSLYCHLAIPPIPFFFTQSGSGEWVGFLLYVSLFTTYSFPPTLLCFSLSKIAQKPPFPPPRSHPFVHYIPGPPLSDSSYNLCESCLWLPRPALPCLCYVPGLHVSDLYACRLQGNFRPAISQSFVSHCFPLILLVELNWLIYFVHFILKFPS